MLAKDKPPAKMLPGKVVYQLPDMNRVLLMNVPYKDKLTADIYYPPDFKFVTQLPVVLFVNGVGDTIVLPDSLKDTEQYISWGQLTAASGMIAVTYAARQPQDDALDLINFVIANSDQLGIDHTKIVLWSCSANTPVAIKLLTNLSAGYQAYLRGAVFYYGVMGGEGYLPRHVRLFVMKGGKDTNVDNGKIDEFVAHARGLNTPVELVEYAEGIHAFDVRQDTDESRAIIKQTLDFMKETLLNKQ